MFEFCIFGFVDEILIYPFFFILSRCDEKRHSGKRRCNVVVVVVVVGVVVGVDADVEKRLGTNRSECNKGLLSFSLSFSFGRLLLLLLHLLVTDIEFHRRQILNLSVASHLLLNKSIASWASRILSEFIKKLNEILRLWV